jgi:hypothetical protein
MRTSAVVLFIVLGMAVVKTRATMVVPTDLPAMSHGAIAIARGRVAAVQGRWTDDRRTIETIVTLEVDGYLKGSLGATLQFRVPGGELGRFRSVVVGAPGFAVDDRIIVFLGSNGPMVPYIVGFNQGVYRIVPAANGSGWLVTPPVLDAPATKASRSVPASTGTPIVRGDVSRRPLPLADFEQRVRALVGGPK